VKNTEMIITGGGISKCGNGGSRSMEPSNMSSHPTRNDAFRNELDLALIEFAVGEVSEGWFGVFVLLIAAALGDDDESHDRR
jgi:hypothetical protein